MKKHDVCWLMMFGLFLSISWVGALGAWAFPGFSTQPPLIVGEYFSAMSLAGCLLGWLVNLKSRKEDC